MMHNQILAGATLLMIILKFFAPVSLIVGICLKEKQFIIKGIISGVIAFIIQQIV